VIGNYAIDRTELYGKIMQDSFESVIIEAILELNSLLDG